MYKRLLIIAPRNCFNSFDYNQPISDAMYAIGNNSGNNIFWLSIQKLLIAEGVDCEVMSISEVAENIERINSDFDACVMCPANALNYYFKDVLQMMTTVFKQFAIPVFVIGMGAQSVYDYDPTFIKPIKKEALEFVRSVLHTGGSIACRGNFTGQVLSSLGFSDGADYEVLGCPSLYMMGPDLTINKAEVQRIIPAFNGPEMLSRSTFSKLFSMYSRSQFISQDKAYSLLYNQSELNDVSLMTMDGQIEMFAKLISQNRLGLYCDFNIWREALQKAGVNFVFGTRIHGCVAAILSGIPAFVIAKDSRVREMVEFFDIPHARLKRMYFKTPDLHKIYSEMSYEKFNADLPGRFLRFKSFMNSRGLPWGEDFSYIENKFAENLFTRPPLGRMISSNELMEKFCLAKKKWEGIGLIFKIRKVYARALTAFVVDRNKRQEIRRSIMNRGRDI